MCVHNAVPNVHSVHAHCTHDMNSPCGVQAFGTMLLTVILLLPFCVAVYTDLYIVYVIKNSDRRCHQIECRPLQ